MSESPSRIRKYGISVCATIVEKAVDGNLIAGYEINTAGAGAEDFVEDGKCNSEIDDEDGNLDGENQDSSDDDDQHEVDIDDHEGVEDEVQAAKEVEPNGDEVHLAYQPGLVMANAIAAVRMIQNNLRTVRVPRRTSEQDSPKPIVFWFTHHN